MGFHLSWIATKGIEKNDVLRHFELEASGEFEEVPESEWTFLNVQNGWNIFIWNETELLDSAAAALTDARTDAEAIIALVAEGAMVCVCSGWKAGKKIWSISHDSSKALTNLDFEGDLPDSFESLREKCEEAQTGTTEVDYFFDVPLDVARSICGYKHDQWDESLGESPFETLNSLKPKVVRESPPLSEKQKKALEHAAKLSKGKDIYQKRLAAGLSGYSPRKNKTFLDKIRSFFPKGD